MKFHKAISAAAVGNILEWYDFAVYGYLATIIGKNFFPAQNEQTSLLSAFATFGIGFLVRPLGGFVVGRIGDLSGRKTALVFTLLLMAVGTTGIGLVPTTRSIGGWAPALLLMLRLIQGFSAGGEWVGATTFIVEWAPPGKRGYFGSFQQSAVAAGLLLGSGLSAILSTVLTTGQMEIWGWRIPFLFGGILAPIGFYIRRNVGESPAFLAASTAQPSTDESLPMVLAARAFGFTILWAVAYYLILSYLPTFAQTFTGLTRTQALWSNTLALMTLVVAAPLMGYLSDRLGRKPLLLMSCASFVILSYPLFRVLLLAKGMTTVIWVQLAFAFMIALFSGPGPAAIVEMFPTSYRSTWMSTGYTLSTTIFGGFAPYIAICLIRATGSPIAPTYYLIGAALISTLVIIFLRETAHDTLH